MFSFFKKNQSDTEAPGWASFFTQRQYKEFLKAIEKYFYEKDVVYTIEDGVLSAEANDYGFGEAELLNLAQDCLGADISFYQRVVDEHFDSLARACAFEKEFGDIKHDFEKIKEHIGVRLYPADFYEETGKDNSIAKEFAGDIYAMLVYDTEDSILTVKPEDAEKWGKPTDELFETGIKNIWDKYGVQLSEEEIEGFGIWVAQAQHFFTANIVFDTETLNDISGREGLLAGLPNRHAALLYPINDVQTGEFIDKLIVVVHNLYNQGPGSLSDNIFWYKDGHFENLPYTVEEGEIQFSPPESFAKMLEGLPGEVEE